MLIAALAVANASAVSLSWGNNIPMASALFGLTSGSTLTYGAGSQTASIVVYYLLATDLATVQGYTGADGKASVAALAVTGATGMSTDNSMAAGLFGGSTPSVQNSSSGTDYFARIYATFDGTEYYMDVLGGKGTGGYWTTTKSGANTESEMLAWENGTYGGSVGAAGSFNTWVPVPEPATAGLALAGLALLFKRRRK